MVMMQRSMNCSYAVHTHDSLISLLRHIFDYDASADAFGNALGNSIVRQSQQSYADKVAEQERMSAAIRAIGQGAVSGLDDATNQRINEISNQTATNLTAQASRVTNALARNNAIDADASFVAMEAARAGRSQQVVDFFYDTANAAYQRTVSGISAGLAAGNAVRERLAGITEASIARRQAGNALAASQFDAIGGSGFDVRAGYDWEAAAAFQDAAWADGRRRAQTVQQAKDVFNQAYETGEVTIAWGGTAGAEAGAGVDFVPKGRFLSVNFSDGEVTFGNYKSIEFAANLGIPMPELHGGGEISIYPTSAYKDALEGPYTIYGGEVDLKLGSISTGLVETNKGQLTGFQISLEASTPNITKLPGHSAFVRGGTVTSPPNLTP